MRYFSTSGPCNPDEHYTVMRETLVAKGQTLVERGCYFTIFAPRQAGKTTYFQLLFRQLKQEAYMPVMSCKRPEKSETLCCVYFSTMCRSLLR